MPPQYQQQMDPNNPRQMAQGFQQMGQQQPGMLQSLMGSGGGLVGHAPFNWSWSSATPG